MNEEQKQQLIESVKDCFRDIICINHINNTRKLVNPREFKINPFLVSYISNFVYGDNTRLNMAKTLVYPRIMQSSITTSFGMNFQTNIVGAFDAFGSAVPGIDIEFVDCLDGRKKYCQIKAGPSTINQPDVATITDHFAATRRLARTNNLNIQLDEMIVGVLYGERDQLSANYRSIENNHYPVYIGQEFWQRLTGDEGFYQDIIDAVGTVAIEADGRGLIEEVINTLSETDKIIDISSD